jgi:RHS repeat-associated protein
MSKIHTAARTRLAPAYKALLLCFMLLCLSGTAVAQDSSSNPLDGFTPAGLQPGSPAGSYRLSGFDTINPYNGNLNFSLPLLQVGGRGGAGYTIQQRIAAKWTVDYSIVDDGRGSYTEFFQPSNNEWNYIKPDYSPGVLVARQVYEGSATCNSPIYATPVSFPMTTLTRLTFIGSDGTEYELRDKQLGGKPASVPICPALHTETNRGRIFTTSDGQSATFIADGDITDTFIMSPVEFGASGYLKLRDGTVYRFDNGQVTWMRDRNGNKLSFTNNGYGVTSVTDSLNRQITVEYNVTDPTYGLCNRITYRGFGGTSRTLYVTLGNLGTALRPGSNYSIQAYNALFPELRGASTDSYNPTVTTGVRLPNGQSYKFYYNSYGEVARVELPTGGALEYDWGAGFTGGPASGATCSCFPAEIYRRVLERRVYSNGGTGTGYDSRMTYSRPESYSYSNGGPGGNDGYVTVNQYDSGGALLTSENHYYYGGAFASIYMSGDPTGYSPWEEGKEYQTDILSNDGTATVLRRVTNNWVQRSHVSWWSGAASYEPSADPVVTSTTNTLMDTGQMSETDFSYDQFNNKTDTYEYDYGGALLRHTHTDYLGVNPVNGIDYTAAGVYLLSLPSQQWVSTDITGGNKASLTTYAYDQFGLMPRGGITGQCPYYDIDPAQPPGLCSTTGPNGEQPTALTARGNATSVTRYVNASGGTGALTSTSLYDVAGNVVSRTDPAGNTTTLSYDNSFCNDGTRCGGSYAANTYAFPTGKTSAVPDASTLYNYQAGTFGSTSALTASAIYDYYTGLTYSATDANGKTTTLSYADSQGNLDPLDRLKAVVRPDGGRTDFNYFDTPGNLYVQTLSDLDAGRRTESRQYFDKLGRGVRSFRWENQDASNPWLTADTQYDTLGRAYKVSSPYRSPGPGSAVSPSRGWTQTSFDALGRMTQVLTTADNAFVTTSYSGNTVTVTDQHDRSNPNAPGHSRESVTDALGRMTDVYEDPLGSNYHTAYTYDALGNLRTVTQATTQVTQTRTFIYDSLSRLTSAANPESGTVSYTYDDDSNIHTKTDARGVVTTYSYDHLNRQIIATYATTGTGAAQTPTVFRYYDFAANGLGRPYRSEAQATAQTTVTAYDAMGRPTDYQQKFWANGAWGQAYSVHEGYNLAGGVMTETYPSNHTVNYNYDAAGRVGDNSVTGQPAFSGTLGDAVQRTYSSQVLYDQAGGMSQERFATDTPLYNKHLYNSRSQLAEIRVGFYPLTDPDPSHQTSWQRGTIINQYSASGSGAGAAGKDNNGNLREQDLFVPNIDGAGYDQNWSGSAESYTYDSLNRLSTASESGSAWTQSYTYDRWGNRTINASGTTNAPALQFGVNQVTNQLTAPAGYKMNYDAAGNLINDSFSGYGSSTGQQTRFYDAENRMTQAQINSSQSAVYTYDADGRRVKRNTGAGEVWQVYGIGGELLAEYSANASPMQPREEYGYRSGALLVTATLTGGWGAAPTFDDNPLVARQAVVQSKHITQLRSAIDSLRSHKGLAAYSWQANASVGALIKADPIIEMRAALDQALGAPSGGYSAGLAQGQPIQAVHIQELRTRVLSAWQGGTGGVDLRWLVDDQLGTSRMVIDKTGSLAGVTRHDYLPFGEELPANVGWRASAPGYGVGDGVRQQFTGYEGDAETGLDYAQARYYAKGQGRFASADPLQASASAINPQSWNRYAYVGNNPLNSADPTGMDGVDDPGVQGTPANSQAQAQNCTPANPCEIVSDEELQRRGPSGSLLHETSSVTATANDPIVETSSNTVAVSLSSPSVGPATPQPGPVAPQSAPLLSSSSRFGLFGISFGGFAAGGFGSVTAVNGSVAGGINTNGNGGVGATVSGGAILSPFPMGSSSVGYPSSNGWGYGGAASIGPSVFWSNATDFKQLGGPFNTTIIATPLITIQWDESPTPGDNTRIFSFSGPSPIGGIFHFQTTTPATVDVPVLVPLKNY